MKPDYGVWTLHPLGMVIGLGGLVWGIVRSASGLSAETIAQAVLGGLLFVGSAYFFWWNDPSRVAARKGREPGSIEPDSAERWRR